MAGPRHQTGYILPRFRNATAYERNTTIIYLNPE